MTVTVRYGVEIKLRRRGKNEIDPTKTIQNVEKVITEDGFLLLHLATQVIAYPINEILVYTINKYEINSRL